MKIHWTHKLKIRKFYLEGFSHEELSIMYRMHWSEIRRITWNVKQPERI